MSHLSRRLSSVVALGVAAAMLASAGSGTITQTKTFSSHATDVTYAQTAQTFNDFLSAGAPANATLISVSLSLSITESIAGLSITNTEGVTYNFDYVSTAKLNINTAAGSAPDAANLKGTLPANAATLYSIGDPGSSTQQITNNQTFTYLVGGVQQTSALGGGFNAALVGARSADTTNFGNGLGGSTDLTPWTFTSSLTSATPSAYNNTGGTFTLSYKTTTGETFSGAGGTLGHTQTTNTNGVFTVVYNYTTPSVPEPYTFLLIGSGLVGLALFKRASKA